MEQDHLLGAASPAISVEIFWLAGLDLVDVDHRRAAVGKAEQALEGERQVEVALVAQSRRWKAWSPERRPARSASQVAASVPIDDVGLAAGRRRTSQRSAPSSHLPGASHVAEPHLEGGVEAGLGAEVALGQRGERVVDAPPRECAWQRGCEAIATRGAKLARPVAEPRCDRRRHQTASRK